MFKTFSSLAHFHSIICQNVHSLKECTWLSFFFPLRPAGAAGGAGCGRLRAASITFSPRAPHALVFLFCLSVAARQAERQLRGSRTPHSSVHPGCSLLHGYSQFCPAIGSESAELPAHWLSDEKNTASIGRCEVAGCCDWSGSTAPAPWRLGLCKHPGCFFQWSVFTSSSFLPVCVQTEGERLWGAESLVRVRLIGSLLHHMLCDWRSTLHYYDTLTALQARTLTTLSLLAASLLSLLLILHSPFQCLLQRLRRLTLSQSAAAAPQATCYPFGDEQSSGVSGLRRGK